MGSKISFEIGMIFNGVCKFEMGIVFLFFSGGTGINAILGLVGEILV